MQVLLFLIVLLYRYFTDSFLYFELLINSANLSSNITFSGIETAENKFANCFELYPQRL